MLGAGAADERERTSASADVGAMSDERGSVDESVDCCTADKDDTDEEATDAR
jgi:hypothetical protein